MLKQLRNNKAQAITSEYVLVLFLVVGMMTAMTIYFKRAIQARIRDARTTMINTVLVRAANHYNGMLFYEYEPYYANTTSAIFRDTVSETRVLQGKSSGIFNKIIDEQTAVQTMSEIAPPKDADF
jgi:hypothetical protein